MPLNATSSPPRCPTQAIVAAPEVAREFSQQIVETEHLMKVLLEQPNGLARRIVSKVGSDATRLLDRTDDFIRKQPRVSGESAQVRMRLLARLLD
jgi:ATP-dependent Clp protease ATP-binding subunit ClpB